MPTSPPYFRNKGKKQMEFASFLFSLSRWSSMKYRNCHYHEEDRKEGQLFWIVGISIGSILRYLTRHQQVPAYVNLHGGASKLLGSIVSEWTFNGFPLDSLSGALPDPQRKAGTTWVACFLRKQIQIKAPPRPLRLPQRPLRRLLLLLWRTEPLCCPYRTSRQSTDGVVGNIDYATGSASCVMLHPPRLLCLVDLGLMEME